MSRSRCGENKTQGPAAVPVATQIDGWCFLQKIKRSEGQESSLQKKEILLIF
jgi:hypothetical protein